MVGVGDGGRVAVGSGVDVAVGVGVLVSVGRGVAVAVGSTSVGTTTVSVGDGVEVAALSQAARVINRMRRMNLRISMITNRCGLCMKRRQALHHGSRFTPKYVTMHA